MKKVTVIGAGLSGMATAALLARQGREVLVLEKNEHPGGRARVERQDGFTFDMGPTWYLMPEVFDAFFALFGKETSAYYALERLDPCFRVFFESGGMADVSPDPAALRALFAGFEPGGDARLDRYLAAARYKYEVALREFLYRDYSRLADFLNRRLLLEGPRMHAFQSLERYARRYFTSPRARQVLLYNIVFLGSTPRKSPALYSLMSHVDLNLGVYYPAGGMWKLPAALHALCLEQGVRFCFNQEVTRIETRRGAACRVWCGEASHETDGVVAAAEYPHVETALLDPRDQSYPVAYWKRKRMAPSMFLVYLGLSGDIPALQHHNFFFPDDWDPHFETLAGTPGWPDRPAYYIGCPTRTDPTLAPPGKAVATILVPVAAGLDDTPAVREAYCRKIIGHLERTVGQPIEPIVEVRKLFSHSDFIRHYHAWEGTALGLAHTLFQSAVFRPSNRSRKVRNLYFAGQYTHPGIGAPMALISARVTAERIAREQA